MKKILLSVLCLMMIGMQSLQAQVAIAALHHEGKVTLFSSAKITEAIDAAVKGDTIYLSEGVFSGFQIAKGIAVIGSGQQTMISSEIIIGGDSIIEGVVLSSVHVLGDINLAGPVKGLSIRHCRFVDFSVGVDLDEADISMCQLERLYVSSNVQSLTVHSSKVKEQEGDAYLGALYYVNCNIAGMSRGRNAICQNCIISMFSTAHTHVNCLLNASEVETGENYQNCYFSSEWSFDEDLNCSLDSDALKNNGWLGSDGTVVGCNGSTAPFTLIPSTPRVTNHSLNVDNKERKLNVTLTIGAN